MEPETATISRVTRRLVPLLILEHLTACFDRVNVSFAALRMNADLGLSAAAYGFGAGEAGFLSGVACYLSLWFPANHRARIGRRFMVAIPLSTVVVAPLSGVTPGRGGMLGLHGCQRLFHREGLPSIILGIAVLLALINQFEATTWLATKRSPRLRCFRAHWPNGGPDSSVAHHRKLTELDMRADVTRMQYPPGGICATPDRLQSTEYVRRALAPFAGATFGTIESSDHQTVAMPACGASVAGVAGMRPGFAGLHRYHRAGDLA